MASINSGHTEGTGDVTTGSLKSGGLRGKMLFGDSVEIDLGNRLPKYSNQFVGAYAAKSLASDGREFIAYVCEPQYTPRNRVGPAFATISNPSLIKLVGSGIGKIPDQHINRFVFIYENTLGRPIVDSDISVCLGMKSEKVMEKVVIPLVNVLRDMRDNDVYHGAIRINNLFDGGKENFDQVVLGECLSLPPSMAQSVIYEPIDRALAQPTGRGVGTNQDDLYSLGVVLAMMLRSRDPMKSRSEAEILYNKMQYGTYATLLSPEDHFSGSIAELLRGLLQDDFRQRCTLDEVVSWLEGRRFTPKQGLKKLRASRPLNFAEKSYSFAAPLARDLFAKPAEAIELIESGDIQQWVKRSLDDEDMLNRFDRAFKSAEDQGRGAAYWDRLISRIGICLDPQGPIRYKTVSANFEGLATALAESFVSHKDLGLFNEIFSGSILQYWLAVQAEMNVDTISFSSKVEACKSFMRQPGHGFGLERVLYYINPDVHCLSPVVSRFYVRSPEEFVYACEEMAQDKANRPTRIMDRHSIAFLCSKDRKVAEPYLYELSSNEPFRYALGTLQCLAAIQRYGKMPPLKHLSAWMADFIEPVFERFHDRDISKELRKKVAEVRDKGDLPKLLSILDNAELLRTDLLNFRKAMREHRGLVHEKNELAVRMQDGKIFGRREGREMSVMVAGILATLLIIGIIIVYLNGTRIL